MNSMPNHRTENRFEETSQLAYHLWQKAGCPPVEDLKFWLQAEEQLFGKLDRQPAAKAKAAGTAKPAAKSATASAGKSLVKSPPKSVKPQAKAR